MKPSSCDKERLSYRGDISCRECFIKMPPHDGPAEELITRPLRLYSTHTHTPHTHTQTHTDTHTHWSGLKYVSRFLTDIKLHTKRCRAVGR